MTARNIGQLVAGPALALGVAALGFRVGMALEGRLAGSVMPDASDADETYGSLRGPASTVIADDGTPLAVEIDEADDRPGSEPELTVIFSHGYTLNMDCWYYQRRALRGKARLVFWDQRGHGRSGMGERESHTINQLGRDLARVIAECAPTGDVVLVGHSMGGMTIMALAHQFPELFGPRVKAVALLATSSGNMADVRFGMPRTAAAFLHAHAARIAAGALARQKVLDANRSRTNDLSDILSCRYSFGPGASAKQSRFVADILAATPFETVMDFMPELSGLDQAAGLEVLRRIEVLVMVGDHDMMTPQAHSEELIRHLPNAEFKLLPDTGHILLTERHDIVDQQLEQLLDDVRHEENQPGG